MIIFLLCAPFVVYAIMHAGRRAIAARHVMSLCMGMALFLPAGILSLLVTPLLGYERLGFMSALWHRMAVDHALPLSGIYTLVIVSTWFSHTKMGGAVAEMLTRHNYPLIAGYFFAATLYRILIPHFENTGYELFVIPLMRIIQIFLLSIAVDIIDGNKKIAPSILWALSLIIPTCISAFMARRFLGIAILLCVSSVSGLWVFARTRLRHQW